METDFAIASESLRECAGDVQCGSSWFNGLDNFDNFARCPVNGRSIVHRNRDYNEIDG